MVSEVVVGGIIGLVGVILGASISYCLENHREKVKKKNEFNNLKHQIVRELRNSVEYINYFLKTLVILTEKKRKGESTDCISLQEALKKSGFFDKIYKLDDLIDEIFNYHSELKELNDSLNRLRIQIRLFEAAIDLNLLDKFSSIKYELERSKKLITCCLNKIEKIK